MASTCLPTGCRSTARCRRCRPARRSRWRSPTPRSASESARVVDAVGEHDDRAAPSFALCRRAAPSAAIASCSDVAPNGTTSIIEAGSVLQTGRERRALVELRVEREDRGFVARRRPASSAGASPPRARSADAPSMLPLTSNSSATLTPAIVVPEIGDRPRLSVVEHLEVARRQVLHEAALAIADDGGDAHQVDADLERRDRWRLAFLPGVSSTVRAQASAVRTRRADDELAPRHRPGL